MDKGQVVELVAQGKSNEDIAREVGYSYGYVRKVLGRLFRDYGARSRAHLVAQCLREAKNP